jgi:tetratricopeptide (TPR) repeat protein
VNLSQAHPAVQRAIESARRGVLAAPRSGRAWGELGLSLRAHTFDPEANACLAQAMRFDPQEVLWPYICGSSLSVRNRPEAKRCFRRAASLRPDLALPRLRLAELYLEERHLDDAEGEYQSALKCDPENARGMLGLGLVAFARGDVEAARRWAAQSYARDPEQRTTSELLLRVFRRLDDREGAARQQAVLDKLPPGETGWDDPLAEKVLLMRRDPGGMAASAEALLARGRSSEAIAVLEQLVQTAPETTQWSTQLGRLLIQHGDFHRARQVLDAALERHPGSADLHFQSGAAWYVGRRWEQAAAEFRDAVRLKADYSDAQYNLGHALKQLHDRDGAIAAFREAVRFRPDYAAAYTNLGELLLAGGAREAARSALETAARLDPQDPQTRKLLKQLE